jgi:hypothetical protein
MSRMARRLSQKNQERQIMRASNLRWEVMVEVPREVWPIGCSGRRAMRFWKNNKYTCTEYPSRSTEHGLVRHLLIQRVTGERVARWDHLQRIKNETVGTEVVAIEVYPAESQVVNACHVYHLWVLPVGYALPGVGLNGGVAP